MTSLIFPLILCGGAGSRLWPLSHKKLPKQFIALLGEQTLLQETINRLTGITEITAPIIICNQEHRFLVREQMAEAGVKAKAIILEPIGRNTAPAVALAALQALEFSKDPILLVLPADHIIKDIAKLHAAINVALQYAKNDYLVTFGIKPHCPETGYGYIKAAAAMGKAGGYFLESFVEKPDLKTAENYLASGKYYWNSGMFVMRAKVFLAELKKHAPKVLTTAEKAFAQSLNQDDCLFLPQEEFTHCPNISIDYAVMEKTKRGVVVPLDANWSDVGTWQAIWEHGIKDAAGNILRGDVVAENVKNSYIHVTNQKVVAVGVTDHIIVETNAGILVLHKDYCQHLKPIVETQTEDRSED